MSAEPRFSATKQALLDRLLRGEGPLQRPDEIRARPDGTLAPISAEQEHVWLHAAMAPEVPLYNEAITVHRRGTCDPARLAASFNEVVRRHEIWRTDFQLRDGNLVQRVHDNLTIELPFVDLSALPAGDGEVEALRIATEDARQAFDLGQAPLLRGKIIKLGDGEHRLYLALHHIIFDGVALHRVLVPTLAEVYAALEAGQAPAAANPVLQYGDYAVWRAKQLEGGAVERQLNYWRQNLADVPSSLDLYTDHPPPRLPTYRGEMQKFALSAEFTQRLKSVSLSLGVTPYILLLAGFQTILFRYTGQSDLVVGGVVDMRRRPSLEMLMGYFLNSLPIRTRPQDGMSFREFALETKHAVLGMLDACDVPLSRLVGALRPSREGLSHPLFQVLFSIQPPPPCFPEGWDLTQMDVAIGVAKFDLYLELEERSEGWIGRFIYRTDLFEAATIRRMIGHWCTLIEHAIADPDAPLAHLPLLTPDEAAQLATWNDTYSITSAAPLHAMFQAQARRSPDAPAVISGEHRCSFRELDRQSDRIACSLSEAGVAPGALVALCCDRSVNLVAALLGILKTGAAYVPLDPTLPPARQIQCLEESGAMVLLAQTGLMPELPRRTLLVLRLEDIIDGPQDGELLPDCTGLDDLAYVLCTSGTTGKPKAVEITHRALVNLLVSMQQEPGFAASDCLLAVTNLSFDIAGLELFLPLLSGGHVVLASREITADPFLLAAYTEQVKPSVMQATPSMWRALTDAGWKGDPKLKLLVGGEALPRPLAEALLSRAGSVWNMFGPTETTIWSTVHRVGPGDGAVPIGRPIANTTCFVLDPRGNELPVGVPGELYIGGLGLARGYHDQAALTKQRFVKLAVAAGQRLYNTRDIVRRRSDGALEWLGRNDDQVKIRGHRVEPLEVEATLFALPSVRNAAIVAATDTGGCTELIAHVVAPSVEAAALRAEIARRLPDYMVPGRIFFHESLPLSPNGKLDRKQLPAPPPPLTPSKARSMTTIEQRLSEIWMEILGLEEVEASDDFFVLGGHSLLAVRLVTRVEAAFGHQIRLAAFFQHPTLEGLALLVNASEAPRPAPAVIVSSGGLTRLGDAIRLRRVRSARGTSRGTILGMPSIKGHAAIMGVIAANALQDYDIWAFSVETDGRALTSGGVWFEAAREIADRILADNELRPRAILGYSLGGFIAWLVARFLLAASADPPPIINLDGGARQIENKAWQARIDRDLPPIGSDEAIKMLVLHRDTPGGFSLAKRADMHWEVAGTTLERLAYRTLDHADIVRPSVIASSSRAIASFIETGHVDPALRASGLRIDSDGGALFQMLHDRAPPTATRVRPLLKHSVAPEDRTTANALLFLAVATGDARLALEAMQQMSSEGGVRRSVTYAKVAILSQLGRRGKAQAVANAWCDLHPTDDNMQFRAERTPTPPQAWGSVKGLLIGSDAAMDFAASRISIRPRGSSATTSCVVQEKAGASRRDRQTNAVLFQKSD